MKDLTRILQDYCVANNITYHYGIKAHLNLLEGNQVANEVYMLHEPSVYTLTRTILKQGTRIILYRWFILNC